MGKNRPPMWLKCSECGIIKNGIDDMEVHMKTEHLNWLPFKCPQCGCLRALNSQMREHLHSSHRSDQTAFHFEEDSEACNRLREMMDDTIRSSLIPRDSSMKDEEANEEFTSPPGERLEMKSQIETSLPPTPTPTPSPDETALSRKRMHTTESNEATTSSSYSAVAALLASTTSEEAVDGRIKKVKVEEPEEEEEKNEDSDHAPIDPLAAYLSGLGGDLAGLGAFLNGLEPLEGETEGMEQGSQGMKEVKVKKTRSSVVKFCSKCNKGVKSNEKGAHVSYHLSKDFQMNRFQCRVEGCHQESHRKVNIVNHQLKTHGLAVADPSLINDRQQEMAQLYQAQLVELFGTNEPEDVSGEASGQYVKEGA